MRYNMNYREDVNLTQEEFELFNKIPSMTGSEAYDMYGLQADEVLTKTVFFNNGNFVDNNLYRTIRHLSR